MAVTPAINMTINMAVMVAIYVPGTVEVVSVTRWNSPRILSMSDFNGAIEDSDRAPMSA